MLKYRLLISAALFLTAITSQSLSAPAPFWSAEISRGLHIRNDFLRSVALQEHELFSIAQWNDTTKRTVLQSLSNAVLNDSWSAFTRGMVTAEQSQTHFSRAVDASATTPGTLLLLSVEFLRNNQRIWAQEALSRLEKLMVSSNATSVPLIAQQLILKGHVFEKHGEKEMALFCYSWAASFNASTTVPHIRSAIIHFPRDIGQSFSHLGDAISVVRQSWNAQHSLLFSLYTWLYTAITIFILCLFFSLSIQHLPSALHVINEKLFPNISFKLRTTCSLLLILSFLSLGFIPFLWVLSSLLFRFLKKNQRQLLYTALFFLAIHPIDTWVKFSFLYSSHPESSPAIFTRVTSEGFSSQLHNHALRNRNANPGDHLATLSSAISYTKRGDYQRAVSDISYVRRNNPDDPITILTAGNFEFLSNRFDNALTMYGRLNSIWPDNLQVRFNLGQTFIERTETVEGTNIINSIEQKDRPRLNTFMNINDRYFSERWPIERKIMSPEITPGYFWTQLFSKHGIKRAFAENPSFVKHSLLTLILSLLAAVVLLTLDSHLWKKSRVKEVFECKLCGSITCKRCRIGVTCPGCHKATSSTRSGASFDHVKQNIVLKYKRRKLLTRYLGAMLVPGIECFIQSDYRFLPSLKVFLSSMLLAAMIHLISLLKHGPYIFFDITTFFAAALLLVYCFFIFRYAQKIAPVLFIKEKE